VIGRGLQCKVKGNFEAFFMGSFDKFLKVSDGTKIGVYAIVATVLGADCPW
jgi:hypothetical protein